MMRTGPVVSLQVEKFAAIYRGLGNLLNESFPENETSSSHLRLDGVSTLYCVVDLSPSERNHGGRKRNKDQRAQKYRQLYRSDPNVTAGFCPEDEGELFDPGVRGNGFSSVSSDNLCADTHPREYLTLPNSKSKDKSDFEPKRPTQPFTMAVNPSSEQSDSRRGFMEPPSERKGSGPGGQSDPQVLLRHPWRREAQEVVERLEREARRLRAKEQRSDEEDRLDLEWRFQKRVQEIQQRGEGEEEEEEEDLDVMMILQQLDRTSENKFGSVGNINRKQNEEEKHGGNQHSYKQEGKPDLRENGLKAASDEKPSEKIKMASAPEKLTLRERRHLFSLATSA